MKKRILAALMLAATMMFATACGNATTPANEESVVASDAEESSKAEASSEANTEENKEEGTVATEESTVAESSEENQDATEEYTSFEDFYFNSGYKEMAEAEVETAKASFGEVYSTVGCTAEGNSFVYTYTFTEAVEITDEVKATLDSSMEEQRDALVGIIDALVEISGVEDVNLAFRYYNPDETLVYEYILSK